MIREGNTGIECIYTRKAGECEIEGAGKLFDQRRLCAAGSERKWVQYSSQKTTQGIYIRISE